MLPPPFLAAADGRCVDAGRAGVKVTNRQLLFIDQGQNGHIPSRERSLGACEWRRRAQSSWRAHRKPPQVVARARAGPPAGDEGARQPLTADTGGWQFEGAARRTKIQVSRAQKSHRVENPQKRDFVDSGCTPRPHVRLVTLKEWS